MGKNPIAVLFLAVLLLLAAGCTRDADSPTEGPAAAAVTVPAETSPAPTEAPVPETEKAALPYLQRIPGGQQIFQGPGYDYDFAAIVEEAGTYTIVEEAEDMEGNLWGRLKSGVGWVDLTRLNDPSYKDPLLSAVWADGSLPPEGTYHHFPGDGSFDGMPILFRAYGRFREVSLYELTFSGESFVPGQVLCTLPEWTEEKPLVACLDFPGDMSSYGIGLTDEAGRAHVFSICISGKDGSVVLEQS